MNKSTTDDVTRAATSPSRGAFARRHSRSAALLALLAMLIVFHGPLLRVAGGVLVIDQTDDECRSAVVLSATPACCDTAARMVAEGRVHTLVIAEMKPLRSVTIGAMPGFGELVSAELRSRGVDAEQIRVIETGAMNQHQLIRELDRQLAGTDLESISVLCTSTISRYCRTVIDQALHNDQSQRYCVRAVVADHFDPDRWWRTRSGVRQVLVHGLRLAFVTFRGESEVDPTDHFAHLMPVGSRDE